MALENIKDGDYVYSVGMQGVYYVSFSDSHTACAL